jgi:FkbM family methyltransferase
MGELCTAIRVGPVRGLKSNVADNILNMEKMVHAGAPDINEARTLLRDLANRQNDSVPRTVDKPLVLYGAGNLGVMAREYFDRLSIPFLYVVDKDPIRYAGSRSWNNVQVMRPDDVPKEDRGRCLLAVCIATQPYRSISAPLHSQGWRDVVPFYDIAEAYKDRHPLSNGWFAGLLDDEDMEGVHYALANWADDISRAHHLQFIAWHKLREEWMFTSAPVTTGDRFFIPQVQATFSDHEVFVDCGAHHGEVSLRFMDSVHRKFTMVYAIEPDTCNSSVLRSNLCGNKEAAQEKIQIIECALGKQTMDAPFFHSLDYSSQISSLSKDKAQVRTLDGMDIPATFIKYHLEGWEYDALLGSVNTLNRYRPIIAVTTYHNRDGLWKIPAYLMRQLREYVFLLRLHSWVGTGCVLYAIPCERSISSNG